MLAGSEHDPHCHGGMVLLLHALKFHVFAKSCIFAAYGLEVFCFTNVLNLHHGLLVARRLFIPHRLRGMFGSVKRPPPSSAVSPRCEEMHQTCAGTASLLRTGH